MSKIIFKNSSKSPKVAILLATYNGQRFLSKQLDSLVNQTYTNWKVFVSDDGSEDNTINILDSYRSKLGNDRFAINAGPRSGFAINFLSMVHNDNINASYYAYADQDDIWETNKLQRAIDWLNTVPKSIPALYCSRTLLIDELDNKIGYSPLFVKPPSFTNALVQNIASGNTMVFNQAARDIIHQIAPVNIVSHDWLTYIVVSGCGGKVYYDSQPSIRYRQHNNNLVGANSSWQNKLRRVFTGKFKRWNECNISVIKSINRLTPKNQLIFEQFLLAKQRWLIPRCISFLGLGLYRQTLLGNMGLIVSVLFGKV